MKLIGKIGGVEVKFDFYPPNIFKGVIPKQLDGQYIFQLNVFDEAGNTTGGAYKYMYIDFNSLHCHILSENFKFSKRDEGKTYIKVDDLYDTREIEEAYSFSEIKSNYDYKELVYECICN